MTRRFVAFIVASGVAAICNVCARIALDIWLPYMTSIVIAYLIGMAVAFGLNRAFVFSDRQGQAGRQVIWFVAVNVLAIAQTIAISFILARWLLPALSIPHADTIAHMAGVAAPAITSFVAHNLLTFRAASRT